MAVDFFLKIDGVAGESADQTHRDEIEVLSFSWGATQSATTTGTTGRVDIQDMQFTTYTNKSSPVLFLRCATGQPLSKAELFARKSGATQFEYLKITMSDVLISSYQTGGSATEDRTLDQVGLNFSKVVITYFPETKDGSPGTKVEAGWDLKANKSV